MVFKNNKEGKKTDEELKNKPPNIYIQHNPCKNVYNIEVHDGTTQV